MKFPENFLWGAATASHQVEGNTENDWTEWEGATAKLKVKSSKLKVWPDYILSSYPNPLQEENYISGRACDHYNRFKEDFDIAKSLGHTAHRFSIEWSRIEPEEGKFDEKEIEHYRQVILALRERGIEPLVTLWHWTLPLWLRDKGGIVAKKFPEYFARYAEKVVSKLSTPGVENGVRFWITINEPLVISSHSYLKGNWPPQIKNPIKYLGAVKNLIKAHIKAYDKIKSIDSESLVGIAKHQIYFEAYENHSINRIMKSFADWHWNFYFLNKIKDKQDFIGLNHYFHKTAGGKNKNEKISDIGWELYPEAIYHVLKELKKYNKPIYITENGLADVQDKYREWFIKESLKNVHKAIEEGVAVRGYMYWSLLDNFEWAHGFWPRFGLTEIDYKTLERKIRPSAYKYAEIIKNNGIENYTN
ncbi:MAG: glycoside hydrolase family 1 protein [bacterium]|nr:glycoside hydrolase family 1 protein [bacterium]